MKPILYLLFALNGQQVDSSVYVMAHNDIYVFNETDYVKFHVKDTIMCNDFRAEVLLENGWAIVTRRKTIIRNGDDEITLLNGKWDDWTFMDNSTKKKL
jgi:hypothetical protein